MERRPVYRPFTASDNPASPRPRPRRRPRFPRARLELELLEARCPLSAFNSSGPTLTPLVQILNTDPFAGNNLDNISGQSGTLTPNSQVEPHLAVDPKNSKHMVGVWQQDRWSDGGSRGIMAAVTFDGGNTWTSTPIPGVSQTTGGPLPRASDPWVSISPNGTIYVATLAEVNVFSADQNVYVSKSTDGGRTFAAPITLISDTDINFIDDKESVTADPSNGQFAYEVWDRYIFDPNTNTSTQPAWFSRTTDGGQTWEAARPIFNGSANTATADNQIVVLPNGTVVDFFRFFDTNGSAALSVIRSTDHGATWSGRSTVSAVSPIGVYDPNNSQPVRTGAGLPAVAVDPRNGTIYATWEDASVTGFDHDAIALSLSRDGGSTWSRPIEINKTPTNIPSGDQQAFTPSVAVAANGNVAVTYYDFRNPNQQSTGLPTDCWMVFGRANQDLTNPAKWGSEVRLTNASFNIELAPFAFGYFLGDYEGLVAGGMNSNSFSAFFGQAVSVAEPTGVFFRDPEPSASPSPAAIPSESAAASDAVFAAHTPLVAPSSFGLAAPTILPPFEDVFGDNRLAALAPNKADSFDGPASTSLAVLASETADLFWIHDARWRDPL